MACTVAGCGVAGSQRFADEARVEAVRAMRAGDPTAALAATDRAVALDSSEPSTLLLRSSILHALDRDAEAFRDVERAAVLAPDRPDVVFDAASALSNAGRDQEAAALVERAARRHPDNLDLAWINGMIQLKLDHFAVADQEFSRLVEAAEAAGEPHAVPARLGRALALAGQDPSNPAIARLLGEATERDISLCQVAAESFASIGQGQRLLATAHAAVSAAPADARLGAFEAELLLRSGNAAAAAAAVDRLLAADPPAEPEVRCNLLLLGGSARLTAHDTGGALELLRRAVDENADRPEPWLALAHVTLNAGSPADIADLQQRIAAATERTDDRRLLDLFGQIARELAKHP